MIRQTWSRLATGVVVLVGWSVLLVAVDLGIGTLLGEGGTDGGLSERRAVNAGETDGTPGSGARRPEVDSTAFENSPWRFEYWDEIAGLQYEYLPYLSVRLEDTNLRYINYVDGIRRSYQSADARADDPVIWFFGGSTMWGEGQRDDHTIPSEVARLAEDAGQPVHVVNYGAQSYAHWQEMLLFEQELATRPAPDLVVFYDGANEISTQLASEGGRPSHDPTTFDVGNDPPPPVPTPFAPSSEPEDEPWMQRWADNSATVRLARSITGLFESEPAEAATAGGSPSEEERELWDRSIRVYERGRARSLAIAERYGVPTMYFWQPLRAHLEPDSPARELAQEVTAPTINITGALDQVGPDVYCTGSHTNELGAHTVAEAIWPHVNGLTTRTAMPSSMASRANSDGMV